ncbi:Dynein attachment factor N-terminus [Popillia japonica]|uniref:Dynein attachment factor N-terminus n=1 Tax=Popillia japonica TaxID=7064 RepID=A0AAW1IBF1_POPJA
MSKLVKDINNKALYESLNQSLEADKLYWTQNDAKIRASYTSRNYDEFREIVAAAHLQPVQSKDIRARKVIWNSFSKYNDVNE